MDFKELQKITEGRQLPCGGTNEAGEPVVIEAGVNDGVRYFCTTVAQNNNWCRINYYYEDGSYDETYKR